MDSNPKWQTMKLLEMKISRTHFDLNYINIFFVPFDTRPKLTLLTVGKANKSKGQSVKARKRTLFGKTADQEDNNLMSQNNHLFGAWMRDVFFFLVWIRD